MSDIPPVTTTKTERNIRKAVLRTLSLFYYIIIIIVVVLCICYHVVDEINKDYQRHKSQL